MATPIVLAAIRPLSWRTWRRLIWVLPVLGALVEGGHDHGCMTDFLTGYVVAAGAGLAGDSGLKASRQSTGGALSVFETSIGAGPPLHVHDRDDECFYVLDGALSVRCGDEGFDAAAGSFVFLPRGLPHRFWATGPAARLLLIAVPAGIEGYFREINAAASDDERTRIGERHGIRVVPGDQ